MKPNPSTLWKVLCTLLCASLFLQGISQTCSSLNITSVPTESRCMSTGTIAVTATGGSGQYNYKVTGPVNTPYTSSDIITGLSAGTYTVTVKDLVNNCTKDQLNIIVTGSYTDPRFSLTKTDETCMNSNNGTITTVGLTGGRGPFNYTIVAPSPSQVGTSNTTGVFTGLMGGDYAVQMTDSCGGIQTRHVTVVSYTWWIDASGGTRNNCDNADFFINLRDSRGNVNTSGSTFSGFTYGWIRGAGDTAWFPSRTFTGSIGTRRSLLLVAKDLCGNVKTAYWAVNPKPVVAGAVTVSQQACNSFTATMGGQSGLTTPQFCLYDGTNTLVNCNATGIFPGLPADSYRMDITDNCYDTTIVRTFTITQAKPYLPASVTVSRVDCNTFNAQVTGMLNFSSPTFCLFDASNTQITCNGTGVFNNLANGSYSITIKDGCYDTTLVRMVNVGSLIPSVASNVTLYGQTCGTFNVKITGQTNLTSPQYCLYDAADVLVSCNTTGDFTGVPYGAYCMKITNSPACYDTVIQRCFTVNPSVPSVGANLSVTKSCNSITVSVAGQTNLNNPQYCLYDITNTLVSCNTTGVFSGLPYGTYCVDVKNDAGCFDTTIRRCVTVIQNIPAIGAVNLSSTVCAGFTASVAGLSNLSNPVFTLKDGGGTILSTNTNGVFTSLAYGSYCIEMQNDPACYDTLITRCFSANRPKPSVGGVTVNSQTCTDFKATVTGQSLLTSPVYYLVNSAGDTLASNSTGIFTNILFGTYSIHVRDNCYDTSIIRSFTGSAIPVTTNVTASASCNIGKANIRVQFTSGFSPYTVLVYNPVNVLVASVTTSSNPVNILDLPALPSGFQYRVEASDNCGGNNTVMVTPPASTFNKTSAIFPKCPSGLYQNGSSDLVVNVSSNLGAIYPQIVKVDGITSVINYTNQSGTTFTWNDLPPANYIVMYNLPGGCANKLYDTLDVYAYAFPALDKSAAFQCNNSNFSVGASVTGGSAPYQYQIIGSVPTLPSITTSPQGSPVFTITNGVTYSLVRLRAIDACGNATLNDVSILPLQNVVVSSNSNCFYDNITLSIDTIPNASYTWYKMTSPVDSIEVGTSQDYNIPYLLPSDTGTYIAKVSVNSGCLTKLSYFSVTGLCSLLPVTDLTLSGRMAGNAAELKWSVKEERDLHEYIVERSDRSNGLYEPIGRVRSQGNGSGHLYMFMDSRPLPGANFYRLRAVDIDGKYSYSNTITLNWQGKTISVYPNPARDVVQVNITTRTSLDVRLQLFSLSGQLLQERVEHVSGRAAIPIHRQQLRSGMYLLKITDTRTGDVDTEKVIFE